MAYVTYTNVGSDLQHITISATSDPSETEVTQMIAEVEAAMDARFKAVGIDTPVTDSDKLNVVKPIALNGACARVLRSIEIDSEGARVRQQLFDDAMKVIEKRPQILEETTETYTAPGGDDSRGTPRFERGRNEW